jgi:hypothetical protein
MPFPASHPALERALAAQGYLEPTPVQAAVLEADAEGRDLLVSAQTGSGKTVAFGLAAATTLLGDAEKFSKAGAPMCLVIAPTRELAIQVNRELTWLYADAGAVVVNCVGGMDARREQRALNFGAHIVVGTPGRLRDHIERGHLDLSELKVAVLDEADEMLDMGFREDLEFILDAAPKERRTLLFSATLAREIVQLAKSYQNDALRIDTLGRNEPHRDIEYRAVRVAPNETEHAIVNLLRYFESPGALVFCNTRESVRALHSKLRERGFAVVGLSGELSPTRTRRRPAGPARRPRPRLRRHRRRRPRPRPARPRPGHPRRTAGQQGHPAAPFGPHRPGRQEGRQRPGRPLHPPPQGRAAADGRRRRRPVGRRPDRRRDPPQGHRAPARRSDLQRGRRSRKTPPWPRPCWPSARRWRSPPP